MVRLDYKQLSIDQRVKQDIREQTGARANQPIEEMAK